MVPASAQRARALWPRGESQLGVVASRPQSKPDPVSAAGVVLSVPTGDGEDVLGALVALVQGDFEACNRTIVARMDSPVALIPQVAAHIVAAGGKRLRPLLTLAVARMCGYQGGLRHVHLAACVEFIHTATLLHDDVVDESALRRGLASANAVFGNQASVVVADRPTMQEAALAEYGMNVGISFQLVDDALDYVADQAKLGKTVGDVV